VFENVLVGVEGRSYGRDAVALAAQLKAPAGKLTLVHVRGSELRALQAVNPGSVQAEREASLELLERERADTQVEVELVSVVASSPGAGLHRQAEELGADLLVVGSCSHSTLGRVMLGDDTRAALNGAPCAVAVATRGYGAHPTPVARLGVAYNDSPESRHALAVAEQLAAATRATVSALEVVSIPSYAFGGVMSPTMGDTIDVMLAEANERMGKLPGVEGHAVYGLPGEELAAFGKDVDLLVVGSRGYGPVKRLVLGSTADFLERHARCSLLVLPRLAENAPAGDAAA
jgi:nucleotide-binding universal stress UspA family protein